MLIHWHAIVLARYRHWNAIHSSTIPILARQQRHPLWHATHVNTPSTLLCHPRRHVTHPSMSLRQSTTHTTDVKASTNVSAPPTLACLHLWHTIPQTFTKISNDWSICLCHFQLEILHLDIPLSDFYE